MKLLKIHHTKMRFTTNTGKIRRVEDTEGGTGSSKTVSTTKMAVEATKHGTLTNQTLEEQRAWDWTNYIQFIHKKMESTWNSGV